MNIHRPIMPPPCIGTYSSQVLLFTGDRRMPRWQYFFFFFFVCRRLFVISHLMLTCKLLRARVTIADDSFVLSPLRLWLLMLWFSRNPLWLPHKWDRERKHRLENTLKAPVLEPVVSLEAVGDFGQNKCYCSASSECVQVQVQIPCHLLLCERVMIEILKPPLVLVACKFWGFMDLTKQHRNYKCLPFLLSMSYKK